MTLPVLIPVIAVVFAEAGYMGTDASIQVLELLEGWSTQHAFFTRMVITLPIALTFVWLLKIPHAPFGPSGVRFLLWARGVTIYASATMSYMSFARLSLSDATSVWNLKPLPTILLLYIFMGEAASRIQMGAAVSSLAGVLLIAYPQYFGAKDPFASDHIVPHDSETRAVGLILGLGGALTGGVYSAITRMIGDKAHPVQTLTMYATVGTVFSPFQLLFHPPAWNRPKTAWGWSAVVGVVACGMFGQVLETYAYQHLTGATVVILGYSSIVISVLIQWILYRSEPSIPAVVGMAIIIVSGVLAVHYRPVQYIPIKQDIEAAEEGQTPLLAEDELASPLTARFSIAPTQEDAQIKEPVNSHPEAIKPSIRSAP